MEDAYASRLAIGGDHLFFIDGVNGLVRMAKAGGTLEPIGPAPFVTDILANDRFVYAYARGYVAAFDALAPENADTAFQTRLGGFHAVIDDEAVYFSQTGVFKVIP